MIYLRHIASGRQGKFSDGTIKALRGIPPGWVEVEAPKMNIERLSPPEIKPLPTLKEAEEQFDVLLKAVNAPEVADSPVEEGITREQMMAELKEAGVKVSPNIGMEKLTIRYENFKQEN
jgi:2-iminoacetate synthase ThiH